jgi:hypothetical protein
MRIPLQILRPKNGTIYKDVDEWEDTYILNQQVNDEVDMMPWDENQEEKMCAEGDIEKARKATGPVKDGGSV